MKQKRSLKNKKTTKKTTRKVARRSNPSGFKNPKGLATQSGGVNINGGSFNTGNIAGRDITITQLAPDVGVSSFHQLPSPPADFVGRDAELKVLREYVKQGGATICAARGLGGVGKTTLALKLAHDLKSDYPDAQFYLNLQGASEKPLSPSEALAHVIRAYHPTAKLPESEVELRSIYLSVLDGKRALVLMDNAKDAAQVEPLIPPATCLLLVTSRQKFVLPDIRTTDLDELPHDEARTLLQKIAPRITHYEVRITDDLASLCGHLPLALRLAGSALAEHIDFEPAQYVKRLQDKKNRLHLIEASFSLSYDLLTEEQQKLWRMLAIFPSSFEVLGASAVWGSSLRAQFAKQSKGLSKKEIASSRRTLLAMTDETASVLAQDSLSNFVRYSILDYDPATKRYNLHDLAKAFADSRLSEKEKYEAGLRHATHYKEVLEIAQQSYERGNENITQGLKLYDTEVENINAGQAWASARVNESDEIAKICKAYPNNEIITLHLHSREQIRWMECALIASRKLKNKGAEGVHLGNLGNAYSALGETRKAIVCHEQALTIDREIGNRRGEGQDLGNLGLAYADLGETHKSIVYHGQALAIDREIGDRRGESNSLGNLGVAYSNLGEIHKAIKYYEQALKIDREIGDKRGESTSLGNLGNAYSNLGETRKALEHLEQALKIAREIGDRHGEGTDLWNIALAFDELGEREKAIEYAEASLKIHVEVEDPWAEKVRRQLEEWRSEKH